MTTKKISFQIKYFLNPHLLLQSGQLWLTFFIESKHSGIQNPIIVGDKRHIIKKVPPPISYESLVLTGFLQPLQNTSADKRDFVHVFN